MSRVIFKKEGTTMEDLKSAKIRLNTSQFDKKMHFDTVVNGDKVEALLSRSTMLNSIEFNIRVTGNFFNRLKYAEVVSPESVILDIIKPDDLKVRVYGEVENIPNARVLYKWQLMDMKADITKVWEKYISSQVRKVNTQQELSPMARQIISRVKVLGVKDDNMGVKIKLDSQINEVGIAISEMLNISGYKVLNDSSVVINVSGRYCSLSNGAYKITFKMVNPATGAKSEKDELYVGIYEKCSGMYYQKKVG